MKFPYSSLLIAAILGRRIVYSDAFATSGICRAQRNDFAVEKSLTMVASKERQDLDLLVDDDEELGDEMVMIMGDDDDIVDDDEVDLEGSDDDDDDVPDFDAMMDEDYEDGEEFDDDDEDEEEQDIPGNRRWGALNANAKRHTQHHKRRKPRQDLNRPESKQDKKRRLMMYVKAAQQRKKREARVERPIPFDMRTPLSALLPGSTMRGTVISLTKFGAYIDVGTECDGLLHISQMSDTNFIQHPREIMSPGDEIEVIIRSRSPELKKLHLTLIGEKEIPEEEQINDDERIPLDDVNIEDELWGIIQRVTDYGSYIELGTEVPGFLHFMDHPFFGEVAGAHPSTYMAVGQRVRVWVADVDREQNRIKLTAKRPRNLPGPRRSLYW